MTWINPGNVQFYIIENSTGKFPPARVSATRRHNC